MIGMFYNGEQVRVWKHAVITKVLSQH